MQERDPYPPLPSPILYTLPYPPLHFPTLPAICYAPLYSPILPTIPYASQPSLILPYAPLSSLQSPMLRYSPLCSPIIPTSPMLPYPSIILPYPHRYDTPYICSPILPTIPYTRLSSLQTSMLPNPLLYSLILLWDLHAIYQRCSSRPFLWILAFSYGDQTVQIKNLKILDYLPLLKQTISIVIV